MMISLDVLTEKFGPAMKVSPWGDCLVVQGTEFDPDWEAELADLGYKCHFGDLDGHAVTFVQLKKAAAPGKSVYVPPKVNVDSAAASRVYWSAEEDAFLVELWKKGLSVEEISLKVAAKYPIRVGQAVRKRLDRLKAVGLIAPRLVRVSGNMEVKDVEKNIVKNGKGCRAGPDWSASEAALLLDLWVSDAFKSMTKEKRAAELAKMPELEGRSANSIYQKIYKLQLQKNKSEEAETSKTAPAAAEPERKWNGEFGEKCNLDHDCCACDIVECPGRKSEGLQKPSEAAVIEDIVKNLEKYVDNRLEDLVKELTVLREGYDSLSKSYVELRLNVENLWKHTEKTLESFATEMPSNEELAAVRKDLAVHEHSEKSGKVTLPMEVS